MAESKQYVRGVARQGQPMFGTDYYIALADCNVTARKCDRNCRWPHCSRELHYYNRKMDADKKSAELKQLGHKVQWEEII